MTASLLLALNLFFAAPAEGFELASVTVKKFIPVKETDPWIKGEIRNDVHTGLVGVFSIRSDLPSEFFQNLKIHLVAMNFNELQKFGVWIQAREMDRHLYNFFGFDQKFPRWRPDMVGTVIVLDRPHFRSLHLISTFDIAAPTRLFEGNLSVLEVLHAQILAVPRCANFLSSIGRMPVSKTPPLPASAPEKIVP